MKKFIIYAFLILGCNSVLETQNEYWEDGSLKVVLGNEQLGIDSLTVKKHF